MMQQGSGAGDHHNFYLAAIWAGIISREGSWQFGYDFWCLKKQLDV